MVEQLFNTHKFLFTLNYEGKAKGKKIVFVDRDNAEKTIILDKIEVGTSAVSCKLYCHKGKRHIVPFIRIRTIWDENEQLIWDSTDVDLTNVKVIKGFK